MAFVVAAKVVLVVVTLACLSSMGGAMTVAAPVLVPMLWLAAKGSGPYATGAWAFLAFLSVVEAASVLVGAITGDTAAAFVAGVLGGIAVAAAFLLRAANDAEAHEPAI